MPDVSVASVYVIPGCHNYILHKYISSLSQVALPYVVWREAIPLDAIVRTKQKHKET